MMMNVHNKYRYSFIMLEEKYIFKGTNIKYPFRTVQIAKTPYRIQDDKTA